MDSQCLPSNSTTECLGPAPTDLFFFFASSKSRPLFVIIWPRGMSELVAALEDPSLPLVGRLKVACYLWQQDEMLSSDLLLGWVCNELCQAYNRKSKTTPPPLTCSKLWQFLCVVLEAVVETDSVQDLDLSPLNTHLFQVRECVFL